MLPPGFEPGSSAYSNPLGMKHLFERGSGSREAEMIGRATLRELTHICKTIFNYFAYPPDATLIILIFLPFIFSL